MFAPIPVLRTQLQQMLDTKQEEGHDVAGLQPLIDAAPDDYQALYELSELIDSSPLRADWPFDEPSELAEIHAQQHPDASRFTPPPPSGAGDRVHAGFLGSVAGCILGKPVEVMPDLDELQTALSAVGEWPLDDYIPERLVSQGGFRVFHRDWPETVRERIHWVAADDDINYTLLGMMVIEQCGLGFTKADLRRLWLENVPLAYTWGPERTFMAKQALAMGLEDDPVQDFDALPRHRNPGEELCGAMIRADAYGYAAIGNPALASDLAWRDASLTHRANGIYGAMFAAAAIAATPIARTPIEIFEIALRYVPQRSRFHAIVSDSIARVAASTSWRDGYEAIHGRYQKYGHCRVFQETGTLVNTLHHATSVGDGICIQVSQGNDTDSYGATAGAILGAWFGPGHLEDRWLQPFNDVIRTRLAGYYESSLTATADRIAELPALLQAARSS